MEPSGDNAPPFSSVFGRRVTAGDTIAERYRVVRELGEGGMGQVLEVEHIELGKHFALKLVRPDRWDATLDARFRREARALAQVNSPRVAQVTDFGVDSDRGPFYVMELIDGIGLDALIAREGGLSRARGLEIARGLALALIDVHGAGIVHRDIKPSNIGICRGPVEVRLLDFGLAASIDDRLGSRITETQRVVGSMPYMSPEQFHNAKPSVSMDLWALGVVLFEMWTGRPPFDASSAAALIHQILSAPTPWLDAHDADGSGVLASLLAKDPEQRPQSAEEALRLLERAPATWSDPKLGSGKVTAVFTAPSGLADTAKAESMGAEATARRAPGQKRVLGGVALGVMGLAALLFAWWTQREPPPGSVATLETETTRHDSPSTNAPPAPRSASAPETPATDDRPSDRTASASERTRSEHTATSGTSPVDTATPQGAASTEPAVPAATALREGSTASVATRDEAATIEAATTATSLRDRLTGHTTPRRPDVTIMPVEPTVRLPEETPRRPDVTIMPVEPTVHLPLEHPREPSSPPADAWNGGIIERSP